jgi:hypothetical protein
MAKSNKNVLNRRRFLGTATAGAASLAASANLAPAQQPQPVTSPRVAAPDAAAPNAVVRAAETGTPPSIEVLTNERPGSDFMVDVLKSLGLEYICSNPGSSFRALHESVINYGGNRNPEFLTCCHEESAVGMAHGYAKIEGKPLAVFAHGTVGLQHAAMAIYNAYCDRVPVYVIFGNIANATNRRPGVEWAHSVQDGASLVRDFVKWDDAPASLTHFAESAVRAYKIAMTPPTMPIVLVADGDLQEDPIPADARLSIPKLTLAAPPQGESGAVAEAATMLVKAENPVIIADRAARTPNGMKLLVELAEVLQAPVIDQGRQCRRDPGPRAHRLLGYGPFLPRSTPANLAVHHEARSETDRYYRGRSLLAQQLPGLRALSGTRPRHRGRCRSDAAVSDRSDKAPDHGRSQTCFR